MKRSLGVTLSAVVVLLGSSLLGLAGATLVPAALLRNPLPPALE